MDIIALGVVITVGVTLIVLGFWNAREVKPRHFRDPSDWEKFERRGGGS